MTRVTATTRKEYQTMRFDMLHKDGESILLNAPNWKYAYRLAILSGWRPTGTMYNVEDNRELYEAHVEVRVCMKPFFH